MRSHRRENRNCGELIIGWGENCRIPDRSFKAETETPRKLRIRPKSSLKTEKKSDFRFDSQDLGVLEFEKPSIAESGDV